VLGAAVEEEEEGARLWRPGGGGRGADGGQTSAMMEIQMGRIRAVKDLTVRIRMSHERREELEIERK
jgi:hypothetical protein